MCCLTGSQILIFYWNMRGHGKCVLTPLYRSPQRFHKTLVSLCPMLFFIPHAVTQQWQKLKALTHIHFSAGSTRVSCYFVSLQKNVDNQMLKSWHDRLFFLHQLEGDKSTWKHKNLSQIIGREVGGSPWPTVIAGKSYFRCQYLSVCLG